MVVPPTPFQRRARLRDAARTRGPSTWHSVARWVVRVLLIAGVLFAVGSPALAATRPGAGPHEAAQAIRATQVTRATQTTRATLTSMVTPAVPGGVCQVPGIGDIGGLVGLCSAGSSGIVGDLNNICEPSLPQPEQATGGIDAMVEPPAGAAAGKTLYDNYGIAGQFWAAHGLQCSDMTSLIGNNVAGMVFDAAKSLDRVTITVYQSAAGNSILNWLRSSVDQLISALGNAIYFPYLAPVVILGAIWLAWQGLIRKRASRTIEGTLWMVIAAAVAIALIGRPAVFTGVGTTVSDGTTAVLNTAFAKLPAPANSNCLPVTAGDPQSVTSSYAFTSGNGLVDQNANELWSVLVCKPWLWGELGTTAYAPTGNGTQTVVNTYGRQLLWAQAIAANETPTPGLIQAKQATYTGIANSIQQNNPGIYPLFQGDQWTTRLEIAFAALFAAVVAGLLILLIALTLIVLKLGFLLLLVAGPFFLIIGTHPGFGRIVAIRWFEMLVGVLMKQVAIAIVLSVLLYCYSLIMGASDQVLPWALKILMIALVTVAVFIYRKPFTHLFSAVGYGTLGSTERAEYNLREASLTFRRSTLDAATVAVPGVAGYRAARWARRNPGQAAALATGVTAGVGVAAAAAVSADAAAGNGTGQAAGDGYASRLRPEAPPAVDGGDEVSSGSRGITMPSRGGLGPPPQAAKLAGSSPRGSTAGQAPSRTPEADGGGRTAPPLDLPPRPAASPNGSPTPGPAASRNGSASAASGWSRGAGRSTSAGPAGTSGTRVRATSTGSAVAGPGRGPAGSAGGTAWPSKGWSGATTRQPPTRQPPTRQRAASGSTASVPPPPGGGSANGHGQSEPRAMPFWLRPIRRDK